MVACERTLAPSGLGGGCVPVMGESSPPNSSVEVLAPSAPEGDLIGK